MTEALAALRGLSRLRLAQLPTVCLGTDAAAWRVADWRHVSRDEVECDLVARPAHHRKWNAVPGACDRLVQLPDEPVARAQQARAQGVQQRPVIQQAYAAHALQPDTERWVMQEQEQQCGLVSRSSASSQLGRCRQSAPSARPGLCVSSRTKRPACVSNACYTKPAASDHTAVSARPIARSTT